MGTVKATGQVNATCDCGHVTPVNLEEIIFEESDIHEKPDGMGTEVCRTGEYEFRCEGCGEDCAVTIDVWEYSVGVLETVGARCSGCTLDVSDDALQRRISIEMD